MRARNIAVDSSACSAFAAFIATISALSVPPPAPQADTPAVSATARAAEARTKLAKQRAELNTGQISAGGAEARALNGSLRHVRISNGAGRVQSGGASGCAT
jgi:hypothetical protein